MDASARHQRILDLLAKAGYESVQTLADALRVSVMTIRRDLDQLESGGLIRRTHGGAVGGASNEFSLDFAIRRRLHEDAKRRIAEAACKHLREDQVVYVDSGTTTLAIADAIARVPRVTVVTPSLPLAQILVGKRLPNVHLLGGEVRYDLLGCVGPNTEQALAAFHLDVALLGASGVHLERGLCRSTVEEIPLKRQAARQADRVLVLVTRDKIGRTGAMFYLPPSEIDLVITDAADGVEEIPLRAARVPAHPT